MEKFGLGLGWRGRVGWSGEIFFPDACVRRDVRTYIHTDSHTSTNLLVTARRGSREEDEEEKNKKKKTRRGHAGTGERKIKGKHIACCIDMLSCTGTEQYCQVVQVCVTYRFTHSRVWSGLSCIGCLAFFLLLVRSLHCMCALLVPMRIFFSTA